MTKTVERWQTDGPVKVEFAADFGASVGCGYKLVDMVAVIPLAVACGLWGAAFNAVNIRLNKLRARFLGGKYGIPKLVELLVIVLITSGLFVVLPLGFECKSTAVKDLLQHELVRIQGRGQLQCTERTVYEQFLRHIQHLARNLQTST